MQGASKLFTCMWTNVVDGWDAFCSSNNLCNMLWLVENAMGENLGNCECICSSLTYTNIWMLSGLWEKLCISFAKFWESWCTIFVMLASYMIMWQQGKPFTGYVRFLQDVAATLATEEAEDAGQMTKLRSALESVEHKRRKVGLSHLQFCSADSQIYLESLC